MSNQIVSTPRDFLLAIKRRFGPITFDLAANADNSVARKWYGPGGLAEDSLAPDIHWPSHGLCFLNPPFKTIAPWVKKAAVQREVMGTRIALLVPAAVCTSWFVEHVAPHAYVFELTPRVFKNEIRDCLLCLYEPAGYVGRETWKWR
ncbi:MAG: DNA N-6-adenine-methyltransferase [Myxococcales bacterium]